MTTPAQWLFQPFEWTHSKSRTHTSLSMQVCTRLHTHTHGQTISRTAKSNLYEQIAAHLLKLIVTQCYTMTLRAGQAVTGRCSTVCVLNFKPQSGENSKQQCWRSSMTHDNWVFAIGYQDKTDKCHPDVMWHFRGGRSWTPSTWWQWKPYCHVVLLSTSYSRITLITALIHNFL